MIKSSIGAFLFSFFLTILLSSCQSASEPEPAGSLLSQQPLDQHELEYYGYIHFKMNTCTAVEWGGGESPESFISSQRDTRQWPGVAKEAKIIIDHNNSSWWSSDKVPELPQEVVIELGENYDFTGLTYSLAQDRWPFGLISHYEFLVSSG